MRTGLLRTNPAGAALHSAAEVKKTSRQIGVAVVHHHAFAAVIAGALDVGARMVELIGLQPGR
jgi:hypothetical protein